MLEYEMDINVGWYLPILKSNINCFFDINKGYYK